MSNTRKFIVLIFTVMLVISLQFNSSLNKTTYRSLSLKQVFENLFVSEAFATITIWDENVIILLDGSIDCMRVEPPYNCKRFK